MFDSLLLRDFDASFHIWREAFYRLTRRAIFARDVQLRSCFMRIVRTRVAFTFFLCARCAILFRRLKASWVIMKKIAGTRRRPASGKRPSASSRSRHSPASGVIAQYPTIEVLDLSSDAHDQTRRAYNLLLLHWFPHPIHGGLSRHFTSETVIYTCTCGGMFSIHHEDAYQLGLI